MKTVYLCGGINNLTDSECKDWRELVKNKLDGQYHFLDPMRRDYRGKEAESVDEIVELDKIDIDNSDILIVNGCKPSWGTAMEIMYAFDRTRDIYTVCDAENPSPWLRYHSDKMFETFDDAIAYLGK